VNLVMDNRPPISSVLFKSCQNNNRRKVKERTLICPGAKHLRPHAYRLANTSKTVGGFHATDEMLATFGPYF